MVCFAAKTCSNHAIRLNKSISFRKNRYFEDGKVVVPLQRTMGYSAQPINYKEEL